MSAVDFEECCHKLLRLAIRPGQEIELCNMVIECCTQDRTYLPFYGHIGQRFCNLFEVYQDKFSELFASQYEQVHRLEQGKLRNLACFFAHLMYTDSIHWKCLSCIVLTEDATSASSRIFVKILFQEIASNLGLKNLVAKLSDAGADDNGLKPYLTGVFPKDSIQNARFSVNYFTSIGLGALTEDLRTFLQNAPKLMLLEKKYEEMLALAEKSSSSSSSSSSSDSSDSDSDSDSESSSSKSEV